MQLVIRPPEDADVTALANVHVATRKTAYRGIMSDDYLDQTSLQDYQQKWQDWISPGNSAHILVATTQAGEVVGFLMWGLPRDDPSYGHAEIYALNVHPDWQRQHVGQTLFTHAQGAIAAQIGAHASFYLWVVSLNHRARNFYAQQGGICLEAARKIFMAGEAKIEEVAYFWPQVMVQSVL